MKHGPAWRVAAVLAATGLGVLPRLHAAGLVSARFEIKPERPYVNQPFELHLYVETTPGAELQDLSLDGVRLDALAAMQEFQKREGSQVKRGEQVLDVAHFVGNGRALRPMQLTVNGILRATLVERHSIGFFTSWRSSPGDVRVAPFGLVFRPLPADAPAGFAGAVGRFALDARATPDHAAPGDIVTVDYTLSGEGWLGSAALVFPDLGRAFRSYPPQELQRDETGTLKVRQVIVPLATDAVLRATATLPYFDPVAGAYRSARAASVTLTVSAQVAATPEPAVKRVDVQPPAALAGMEESSGDAVGHLRQLLPFLAVLALALIAGGAIFDRRPRTAIVVAVLVFAAGTFMTRLFLARERLRGEPVREAAVARLAPSDHARELFRLQPGQRVTILEHAGEWTRVDQNERRGWIPAAALPATANEHPERKPL